MIAVATSVITANQDITRCSNDDCLLCRDSIAGGPLDVDLSEATNPQANDLSRPRARNKASRSWAREQ